MAELASPNPTALFCCRAFGVGFLVTYGLAALGVVVLGVGGLIGVDGGAGLELGLVLLFLGLPVLVYVIAASVLSIKGNRGGVIMGLVFLMLAATPVLFLIVNSIVDRTAGVAGACISVALVVLTIVALQGPAPLSEPDEQAG